MSGPQSTHGGDQTWNIWMCRSTWFPGRSCEWRGLRTLTWKLVWNVGDSREKLLENLAIGIILSPISSARGLISRASRSTQRCTTLWIKHVKRDLKYMKETYKRDVWMHAKRPQMRPIYMKTDMYAKKYETYKRDLQPHGLRTTAPVLGSDVSKETS